jgi:hypothetical protein
MNAPFTIRDSLDSDPNITKKSDLHSDKHVSLNTSTDSGIMISTISVLMNASFTIPDNLDPDSNLTEDGSNECPLFNS